MVSKVAKPWVKQPQKQGQAVGKATGKASGKSWSRGSTHTASTWGAKGKGKGRKPKAAPKDFEVDKEARYTGTVTSYRKLSGFGFIQMEEAGIVPEDKVYVNWRNLKSEDRFPFLKDDMVVEFGIIKVKDKRTGVWTLKANSVSLPGGAPIAIQDDLDAEKKEFVGDQYMRYTGKLKFYAAEKGFGYVLLDDGFVTEEDVPKELRVERSEVNAGGRQPKSMKDLQVEFSIQKTKKGGYRVYNMTFPGGAAMTQEAIEHRNDVGGIEYQGEVEMWNRRQGWGWIKVEAEVPLPDVVMAAIEKMNQATKEKGKEVTSAKSLYFRGKDIRQGVRLEKGQQVSFQVYTDDKGAGATDIH